MIPEWKWDRVTMDCVGITPNSEKERCYLDCHYSLDRLVELYISKIVQLHGRSKIYVVIFEEIARSSGYEFSIEHKDGIVRSFVWSQMLNSIVLIHEVDLIRETEKKVKVIHDCMKIGDKVFLKVSSWKKILCFSRKGKLSPRFIRPYEITERIGLVAYQLALPSELEKIYNIFHVSMLCRYKFDHHM
ncbi:DNA/RNA polymerases superfamily protein [Gossypium australe]|uniref:DNA/RNA polymerases superfamily protein n=1 Tax=Gossypium australe TaxID=47621 RepID=A0A5B6VKX6_9ROSI|nr:DNA/RNA polymerases superfamily protein [Gossypium australe]